jgi:hypothetical protein
MKDSNGAAMVKWVNREKGKAAAGVLLAGAFIATSSSTQASKAARKNQADKAVKIAQATIPTPALQAPQIESLRVTRGSSITLPLSNVTIIRSDNEEIARGRFDNGKAIIEGVTTGVTTVEVQQESADGKSATKQRYEVEVLSASPLPAPAPIADANSDTQNPSTTPLTAAPVATATTTPSQTPATPILPAASPTTDTATTVAILPDSTPAALPVAKSPTIALSVEPAEDNPSQALFTITYGNPTAGNLQNAVIRYALDDMVSYVTASATGGAKYDAAARELTWNIETLPSATTGKTVQFRIAAQDPSVEKFYSVATIETADSAAIASKPIEYSFTPTPLLTVFAIPDRILQGKNRPTLVDVRGLNYQAAVDRMQTMGVVEGVSPGTYEPSRTTERAEYTVMILRGLNLKDLRDMSAIKFVLSRRSTVNLDIRNSAGKVVATLIQNMQLPAGERTVIWNGKTAAGFAPAGRYTYSCTARDAKGTTTTLRGYIHVIPQTPLDVSGQPTFSDVRPGAWYSGYLAEAQRQDIVKGYPTGEFRPKRPINRVEATAIVVRAIGLEDVAKRAKGKEAGFLDDHMIPDWGTGYVYTASTIAKTNSGHLIVGNPSNMFLPLNPMRRDAAALVVQRMVDKETNRKIYVSGQLVPGAVVTINSHNVQPEADGQFSFVIEQNSTEPTSVAVIDRRR